MAHPMASNGPENKIEDLSGAQPLQLGDNPYQVLIAVSGNDPKQMQLSYETHRATRHSQQRAKFLDPDFSQLLLDASLLRIEDPSIEPGFEDQRHGCVFWARPPNHILHLAGHLQALLTQTAPNIWLMPLYCMHMTTLEICHSRTPEEIAAVIRTLSGQETMGTQPATRGGGQNGMADIVNYTFRHRARLVRPFITYDVSAVALSFVPAAGEPLSSPPGAAADLDATLDKSDNFTYHHLRRDLFDRARQTGIEVASRYVVPSAHMTLARFVTQQDHATPAARQAWVDRIDTLNLWLEKEVWPASWDMSKPPRERFVGEWTIGQERGLDARVGALWYGGGRSVMVGEGF